jgi:Na+/H+ antiporter NhaD/arsenite permease-like protein
LRQASKSSFRSLQITGGYNFIWLGGIIAAVLLSGLWRSGEFTFLGIALAWPDFIRDILILAFGLLSLVTTSKAIRSENGFTWGPIKEVAILFAGIFATILPALAMLRAGEGGALQFLISAVEKPWHYFWAAGGLSSFLDNAPTYLTFFNLELGRLGISEVQVGEILRGLAQSEMGRQFIITLEAISIGAVFMGANSYIGNAPNFMVRSIAEENKIQMPSFFGYMLWSVGILVPLYLLVTWIFF